MKRRVLLSRGDESFHLYGQKRKWKKGAYCWWYFLIGQWCTQEYWCWVSVHQPLSKRKVGFLCWIYHELVFPLNLLVQFLVTTSISFYRSNLVYKQIYSQVVRRPAWVRLSMFIAVWEEHATELHLPSLKLVHIPAPSLFEIYFNIVICT